MRAWYSTAAFVLALLAGRALHARADAPPGDPPPAAVPGEVFTQRAPDVGRASAAKLWNAVDLARKAQLFQFAVEQSKKVLDLDPDHAPARALLGFVKKDGAWVADAALAAKTPRVNFADKLPTPDEAAAVERKWWKDGLLASRAAASALWAGLGDESSKRLDAESAEKAYRRALTIHPDQEHARKALGFYRWHEVWMTADQVRACEAASVAKTIDLDDAVDKAFGVKLSKVETIHFRIESRIPADRLTEMARWLEIAYAVHMATIGRDPSAQVFPTPVRFVICDSDAEWNTWIDKFVPRNKDFYRTIEGVWAEGWMYAMKRPGDNSDESRRDHLMHRAIHAVDSFTVGLFWPSWVDEGLSHYTTVRVQGMTRTWCLAPSRSEYAKLLQANKTGWVDEREWRATVRAAVAARNDLELRGLVLQPFAELGFDGVLKAWSMVDFWMATDPDLFRALLPKLRAAKDPAAVIEKHFEKAIEGIDQDWRRYVLRTY